MYDHWKFWVLLKGSVYALFATNNLYDSWKINGSDTQNNSYPSMCAFHPSWQFLYNWLNVKICILIYQSQPLHNSLVFNVLSCFHKIWPFKSRFFTFYGTLDRDRIEQKITVRCFCCKFLSCSNVAGYLLFNIRYIFLWSHKNRSSREF